MTRLTVTLLLATFTLASAFPTLFSSIVSGETISCTQYAQANTESATCGDRSNFVCSQKCSGGVVVDGCSLAQQSSAPLTRQTCTIAFSQTSATNSICVNSQGSFSCSGVPSGQATCSGCSQSQAPTSSLIGALGGSAATIVPTTVPGPTSAAPPVAQNHTVSALTAKANSTLPTTVAVTNSPVTPSSAVVSAASVPADAQSKSDNTTSASPVIVYATSEDERFMDDGNTTSMASSRYSKNCAPLVATLGLMAVGFVAL